MSLILGSYVRHVWKTTDLYKSFSSSLEILDEMRPIRCIEHPGRARVITPFLKRQLEICEAFGFTPPKNCDKVYKSRQVTRGKKRGRPRKETWTPAERNVDARGKKRGRPRKQPVVSDL